jgi:hypothetical protein
MTQAERVLTLLAVRGEYGICALDLPAGFRLAARIKDLRDAGNNIETYMVRMPGGARMARYYLHETPVVPTTGTQTEAFR